MSYRFETSHNAAHYSRGRDGQRIEFIVIHHWGADGQTHDNVVRFFETTAQTSAHFVASAGRVSCLVDCSNTAWHAGNWQANTRSIGIECRPEMSNADLNTVAELIADIWHCYGELPLKGHRDFFPTNCPGRYYSQLVELRNRAKKIRTGQTSPAPNPILENKPKGKHAMFMLCLKENRTSPLFAVTGPNYWMEFTGQSAADNINKQICGGPALICTRAFWEHCKAAAGKAEK